MRKKKVNRKYKDRLFRLVFEDRSDLLELYNAVNGSHYDNPADLEITTLDDAVYIGMKNDISFLIGDILNLYEHQSSYNPNMPIRGLLYLADVYRKIIDQQELNVYSYTRLSLPYPKYVVFYNGTQWAPDRIEMKLSDSFNSELTKELSLEFVAVMLNINVGHNKEIMEGCRRLKDYSSFVGEVRLLTNEGIPLRTAVDTAIDTCIERDILADILSAHRAEVRDMCLYDYDFKKHMEMERKEWEGIGLEKGLRQGLEQGLEQGVNQGIKALITSLHTLNHSYDETFKIVSSQFLLSESKTQEFLKLYW